MPAGVVSTARMASTPALNPSASQMRSPYRSSDSISAPSTIASTVALVTGLSIPNAPIAKGKTQTKLVITAAADATDGTRQLTVRVTLKLNNQNLVVEQPINLTIQKVDPPKEPAKK